VTPQVNKDGYITMLLRPTYVDTQTSSLTSASNPVIDPVTRALSTMVRVKSGQTLVLGGLLQTTETKDVEKVPFIGYIPIIGWLFTHSHAQRHNLDLVVFVTPTVVNN
jgi:type II secretory pathway component GspD/PulD (secretin)